MVTAVVPDEFFVLRSHVVVDVLGVVGMDGVVLASDSQVTESDFFFKRVMQVAKKA